LYETFEHTAGIGHRALAADFNTLFAEAAKAILSVIVDLSRNVPPPDSRMGKPTRLSVPRLLGSLE
jgi:SHS2 domain-containing protein